MLFCIEGNSYKYELEKLSRLFLPFEKFIFISDPGLLNESENYVYASLKAAGKCVKLKTKLSLDGKKITRERNLQSDSEDFYTECERTFALMLFDCFTEATGYVSPWGILTGVRPAKLMGSHINKNGEEAAYKYFTEVLRVSPEKTKLCLETYKSEERIIAKSDKDSVSLYVSVPFCPSRCSYCSFVSHSVDKANKLIGEYVTLLCRDIEITGRMAKEAGLKLKTVYMGGGTPTTVSAKEMRLITDTVARSFDFGNVLEYTIEAGRPDTVTEEKLKVIKSAGVTRISINPQTLNDDVLRAIGRRHTVEQFYGAFSLARKIGFDNINTDLIAGLSGDSVESFKRTVDGIVELSPENVTVHSLSMKRASNLNQSFAAFDGESGKDASFMVDYAREKLCAAGIKPYYMYRQSKTVGNLENVGYSKPGYEGLYNVYIMDETHTILACGASAVTKLKQPGVNNIERVFGFKYPYEYISRFDEMIAKKQRINEFFKEYL